ncbi:MULTISPECIES: hypothetical protein [Bradyrhizobium]|uniref:hypothetical protein n=1 Tax=Bradyrhizobium TaxID=374 RepID=UPI001EDC386E|nr:hypothetical protein [Bradyrhizobium zhengyangense]MCG2645579.1 hypothetical protein [Bradyrhizobium zhengyangense]
MLSDRPEISGLGDGKACGRIDQLVGGIVVLIGLVADGFDQKIELRQNNASDCDVEIDIELREVLQLKVKQALIPARVLGELVVCARVGSDLRPAHIG